MTRAYLFGFCSAVLYLVASGCAELGPVMTALPGVVSAVEAVTAAARAQGRPLDAEVLAEAKALDAAEVARNKARDAKIAAILAAVKRKPVACPPAPVAAPAVQPAPTVADSHLEPAPVKVFTLAPPVVDAGADGGQ